MIRNKQAFTFVELAIVITIISLLSIPFLSLLESSREEDKTHKTRVILGQVANSLSIYSKNNSGLLPCPAIIQSGMTATAEAPGCSTTDSSGIAHGAVPTTTLGISNKMMLDAWKRKIEYYVTTAATLAEVSGTIKALNVDLNPGGDPEDTLFVLVSHGEDMRGSYSITATSLSPTGSASTEEISNIYNGANGSSVPLNPLSLSRSDAGDIAVSQTRNDMLSNLFGRDLNGVYDAGNASISMGGSIIDSDDTLYLINPNGSSKMNDLTVDDFTNLSDKQFKKSIKTLDKNSIIAKLNSLKPVSYKWKKNRKGLSPKETQYGFIAQDVERVFPELVKNQDDILSLRYLNLISPIISNLQKLNKQNISGIFAKQLKFNSKGVAKNVKINFTKKVKNISSINLNIEAESGFFNYSIRKLADSYILLDIKSSENKGKKSKIKIYWNVNSK